MPREKTNKRLVSFKLREDLADFLRSRSERLGISMTAHLELLIAIEKAKKEPIDVEQV